MPARLAPPADRRPAQHFTLAEATRALPLVRRIAADVAAAHRAARTLQVRLEVKLPPEQRAEVEADLRRAVDRMERLSDEATSLGCELSDYARGGVEIPARHDGRAVRLCWSLGEPSITRWRDPAARDPVGRTPKSIEVLDEGLPLEG